jgi:hypothetical protein
MKIKNIKEEVTKDMENLRERSSRNTKHSRRKLQQTRMTGNTESQN